MPRNGKRTKNRGFANNSDIRLNDFADSDVGPGKGRMKKATRNKMVKQVREICTATTSTTSNNSNNKSIVPAAAEKDWFDMTLDECNFDSAPEEELDDEPEICIRPTRTRRRRTTTSSSSSVEEDTGNDYPLDIWFILGAYIKPEDVSRFSCICKSAYAVTLTSKFWYRLYRRYYTPVDNLPMRLQPECMERLFCLRSCVIRSLYYFYPLFQERLLKSRISTYEEPDSALKRSCIMLWHQKGRGVYHFYFKLKEYNEEDLRQHCRQDLMEILADINVNTEKRCKVLQVTSIAFASLPPTILGQTLLSVSSVLSSDFRTHTLRLIFGPRHAIHYSKLGKQLTFSHIPEGTIGVSINQVVMIKVLNWWDPMYPQLNDSIEEKPASTTDNSGMREDIFF